jgi:predicted nucleic acid-binding protein
VTLVDTNVLLDLVTDDPNWAEWSIAQLEAASIAGSLLINDVVYAELSVRYSRIEDLETFLDQNDIEVVAMPRAALFLARQSLRTISAFGWHADRRSARLLRWLSRHH